jgi:hypothetical protein
MPSIPLKKPADLASYTNPDNQAHLTVFLNTPTRSNEHLLVVFGTNSFGGIGELANLQMPEEVFQKVAEHYPVTKRANLNRSDDIAVTEAQSLLTLYWPAEPEPTEAPEAT